MDLDSARALFARAPFIAELGIEPLTVGEGSIETRMALEPRHFQHTGQVHAGVMVTLADHSMGIAAQTLAGDAAIITAELSVRLLRAARGGQLFCEARTIKRGRNLSFTEADVYCEHAGERVHVMRAAATMALTRRG